MSPTVAYNVYQDNDNGTTVVLKQNCFNTQESHDWIPAEWRQDYSSSELEGMMQKVSDLNQKLAEIRNRLDGRL